LAEDRGRYRSRHPPPARRVGRECRKRHEPERAPIPDVVGDDVHLHRPRTEHDDRLDDDRPDDDGPAACHRATGAADDRGAAPYLVAHHEADHSPVHRVPSGAAVLDDDRRADHQRANDDDRDHGAADHDVPADHDVAADDDHPPRYHHDEPAGNLDDDRPAGLRQADGHARRAARGGYR
jgi:hypothetical protein